MGSILNLCLVLHYYCVCSFTLYKPLFVVISICKCGSLFTQKSVGCCFKKCSQIQISQQNNTNVLYFCCCPSLSPNCLFSCSSSKWKNTMGVCFCSLKKQKSLTSPHYSLYIISEVLNQEQHINLFYFLYCKTQHFNFNSPNPDFSTSGSSLPI